MEVEDDLFFADLSRQISLLIMDDDDDPVARNPSISLQNLSRTVHRPVQPPFLVRESKGTGVFIPAMSPAPRRKQRRGGFSASANRVKCGNGRVNSQVSDTACYFKPKKG